MEYNIQYRDGFFEVVTFGNAEVDKFKDILEALVAHEKWETGSSVLLNHTNLNAAPLASADMEKIANLSKPYGLKLGKAKCAILIARDLEFGMGRVWEFYVRNKWDVSVNLFKSKDDAIAWLSG